MRGVVLLLLLAGGCTARQECALTCKGCCDLDGTCHTGSDPYACGGAGDCEVCLVGQACVPDGGCSGPQQGSVLQLNGNNAFVPVSAQGFSYASSGAPFLLVSNRERKVCRHPGVQPNVDEEVLIVTSLGQITPMLERVSFVDGGVFRTPVEGTTTIRTQGARVLGTVDINSPTSTLKGSIDAPFCGVFH